MTPPDNAPGWPARYTPPTVPADRDALVARLREALEWALPKAVDRMEICRLERLQAGRSDISGTRKDGRAWIGLWQQEVDEIEAARAALADTAPRGGDGV